MKNFTEIGLAEAWKPLLRAMDEHGLEFVAPAAAPTAWECFLVLEYQFGLRSCFLSFFHEPEWCGNSRQQRAWTIIGLSDEYPSSRESAETHALVLTGDWESAVLNFVSDFLRTSTKTKHK